MGKEQTLTMGEDTVWLLGRSAEGAQKLGGCIHFMENKLYIPALP